MHDLVGTPDNPDIIDHLRSGIDNADAGADGRRELGGVLLTMNEAADEIERLRKCLRACDATFERLGYELGSIAREDIAAALSTNSK